MDGRTEQRLQLSATGQNKGQSRQGAAVLTEMTQPMGIYWVLTNPADGNHPDSFSLPDTNTGAL